MIKKCRHAYALLVLLLIWCPQALGSNRDFTRWLRVFGHRYGFDGSNSSDYDSILVSGHLDGSSSKALNTSENNALKAMQANKRPAQMPKHVKED